MQERIQAGEVHVEVSGKRVGVQVIDEITYGVKVDKGDERSIQKRQSERMCIMAALSLSLSGLEQGLAGGPVLKSPFYSLD